MNKQLKALYETKEMLERKLKRGYKNHKWDASKCPLCQCFNTSHTPTYWGCKGCPFNRFRKRYTLIGCVGFANKAYGQQYLDSSPIDETLSIIISMIQYYEEK